MTDRQIAEKMAEALEAICKGASPARGMQAGSPQFMRFEIKGRLLDEAQEALDLYRHPLTPATPCTESSKDQN